MSGGEVVLRAQGLSFRYGPARGVESIDLEVQRGERVALLGLNGAGKSTTFKLLAGLLTPQQGSVEVDGHALQAERKEACRRLGYLAENAPLCPELTPKEHIAFEARMRRVPVKERMEELVDLCGLQGVLERPISRLSRGFRQRVALAGALVHQPSLLLLDEPTASLDPHQVEQFRQLIARVSGHCGVLVSTHILAEASQLCSRCIILHEGKVASSLALGKVRRRAVEYRGENPKGLVFQSREEMEGGWIRCELEEPEHPEALLRSWLERGEVRVFSPVEEELETTFLNVTQGRGS